MVARPFHLQVGPYWLTMPGGTRISCDISEPSDGAYAVAFTQWVAVIGHFRLSIHLDPINDLADLKRFIDHSTKSDVNPRQIAVNGIQGVMYGDYASPVTRIDWWFKKGDTMICLDLQGIPFSFKEQPTEGEVTEHEAIIGSLTYWRDTPPAPPPLSF